MLDMVTERIKVFKIGPSVQVMHLFYVDMFNPLSFCSSRRLSFFGFNPLCTPDMSA